VTNTHQATSLMGTTQGSCNTSASTNAGYISLTGTKRPERFSITYLYVSSPVQESFSLISWIGVHTPFHPQSDILQLEATTVISDLPSYQL